MKKSFKELNETAHNVAECIGMGLDNDCILTGEEWGLDETFIFRFHCNGIELALEVKDVDAHFYGSPTGHNGKRPELFKHLCGKNPKNPMPLNERRKEWGLE